MTLYCGSFVDGLFRVRHLPGAGEPISDASFSVCARVRAQGQHVPWLRRESRGGCVASMYFDLPWPLRWLHTPCHWQGCCIDRSITDRLLLLVSGLHLWASMRSSSTRRKSRTVKSVHPQLGYDGPLFYATTLEESVEACKALNTALGLPDQENDVSNGASSAEASTRVLGFDCEWKVTFETGAERRPVATVQVAAPGVVAVFHLSSIGFVCKPLAALLCRADVLKVGVGAKEDAHKLEVDYMKGESQIKGLVELGLLAHHVLGAKQGTSQASLTSLSEKVLGKSLCKSEDRISNWEAVPLSKDQLNYAAQDAWASLRVFQELILVGKPLALARTLRGIQPMNKSKLAVWHLFYEEGLHVQDIAVQRKLKYRTVQGYILDAVSKRNDYDLEYDFEKLMMLANQSVCPGDDWPMQLQTYAS